MRLLFFLFIICGLGAFSCNSGNSETKTPLTPEQTIQKNIDSLKAMAREGDLITRMNDNIISYHVKNLNEKDRTFSHAGIVMIKDGQKVVCNIDANEPGLDTVRYDPIDSFINPKENFICALFRYQLSDSEKTNFISELNKFHKIHAHFDRVFDLNTDSMIYCSEMISKSLTRATKGRLSFKESNLPKQMLPLITKFFEQEKAAPKKNLKHVVEERKYIAIDNLYLIPQCKELMRFKLKHFPGDEQQQ